MQVRYQPIGIIHSPFDDVSDMPIQPSGGKSAPGTAEVFPKFSAGLKDLAGFSHVILVYHLHKARSSDLTVTPFLDSEPHGIFATRAPIRPNPIGISIVRLIKIQGNVLYLESLDVIDGTPLLDIKPYVPEFDAPENVRVGWLQTVQGEAKSTTSDARFS
ncbi:MAG: tRNA (N6-threonylcarbamoyladenosine(37)-N6)-methyltransferase TrmO [Anaerolineales bacterium]